MRKGMTQREAAEFWVNGFNAIPTRMIEKLWAADFEDWQEVTRPTVGDRVYASDVGEGEVVSIDYDTGWCMIELYNDRDNPVRYHENRIEIEHDYSLPIWGTMWSFGDSCDEDWFEYGDGIALMSQCGFRIFKNEEFGYFFGIDGAGYDFYEAHWIPLYVARGLKWTLKRRQNHEIKKRRIHNVEMYPLGVSELR